jgi:thymidylate kinase
VSARRKIADRDKYERDLELLGRVRASYLGQASERWVRLDADRDRDVVADDVIAAVRRAAPAARA